MVLIAWFAPITVYTKPRFTPTTAYTKTPFAPTTVYTKPPFTRVPLAKYLRTHSFCTLYHHIDTIYAFAPHSTATPPPFQTLSSPTSCPGQHTLSVQKLSVPSMCWTQTRKHNLALFSEILALHIPHGPIVLSASRPVPANNIDAWVLPISRFLFRGITFTFLLHIRNIRPPWIVPSSTSSALFTKFLALYSSSLFLAVMNFPFITILDLGRGNSWFPASPQSFPYTPIRLATLFPPHPRFICCGATLLCIMLISSLPVEQIPSE